MYRIIFGLFLGLPLHVVAGLWPVVTSMTTIPRGTLAADYSDIQWALLEVGGTTITERPFEDQGFVGAGHRHNSPSSNPANTTFTMQWFGERDTSKTIGEIARDMYERGLLPNLVNHHGSPNGGECVGVVYRPPGASKWPQYVYPPGSCVYAPPGNEWCSVIQPILTLDHGALIIGTGSALAETGMTVECTAPINIKITLGDDAVDLRNGMVSKLNVPGAVGGFHSMKLGHNQLSITSTVDTNMAKTEGPFSGASVVYLEYY